MAKAAAKLIRSRQPRPTRSATTAPASAASVIGEGILDYVGKLLVGYLASVDWSGVEAAAKAEAEKQLTAFADVVRTDLDELGLPDGGDPTEGQPLPETAPTGTTRVSVTGPKAGRWRAGLHFSSTPRIVDLDADDLAAVEADPKLSVLPVATPAS